VAAALPPLPVFLSYAAVANDEVRRDRIEVHLEPMVRQGLISAWHRGRIGAGEEQDPETAAHFDAARIILLLVSADYLASDPYCREMEPALARHKAGTVRVIPILLSHCDWQTTPLRNLSPLPAGEKPISMWADPEEAWAAVVRGIRAAIDKLRAAPPSEAQPSSGGSTGRELPPNNLPPRREHFVGRETELRELDRVFAKAPHASIVPGRRASFYGLGGVGKTALALEYAYRHSDRYLGGIWWIEAEGDPLTGMVGLADALQAVGPSSLRPMLQELPQEREKLALRVKLALQNQKEPVLLVLDNVENEKWQAHLPAGLVCTLLTTRDQRLATGHATAIDMLSDAEATQLALSLAGAPVSDADGQARDRVVLEELGGLAVAVEMAARAVRHWADSWTKYEIHLRAQAQSMLTQHEWQSDYPRSVLAALALSVERCRPSTPERRFIDLAAFLAPDRLPIAPLLDAAGVDPTCVAAAKALATLKGLGLVVLDEGAETVSMHRLLQVAVRADLHERDRADRAEAALHLVDSEFPDSSDDVGTWPWCALWLPHALTAGSNRLGGRVA
jgi:hypothetical protein